MRALVIGSVKQYPTKRRHGKPFPHCASTLTIISVLKVCQKTFEQLVEHYRLIELIWKKNPEREGRTDKADLRCLSEGARIALRWGQLSSSGDQSSGCRAVAWPIDVSANGTKAKIKGIMSEVFQSRNPLLLAQRCGEPHLAVRQSTKAEAGHGTTEGDGVPCPHSWSCRRRCVSLASCATTGLGISEVLGLKWMDIDWKTLQMDVTRSVVTALWGSAKQRPPASGSHDELTTAELLAWKRETCYAAPEDWVFASERVQGKMPPWADTLLDRFLQPAAASRNRRAGRIPYLPAHLFNPAQSKRGRCQSGPGVDAPCQHLHDDEYLHKGSDVSCREAQSRVVDVLLDRSRNKCRRKCCGGWHENQRIGNISRFFCEPLLLGLLADLIGIEPMTSSIPWKRAPSCATAC